MSRLRVNRIKALIVFSVLLILFLCTAFFTVSYAKWEGGGNASATATANGSVGKFYVEYPYTAQTSQVLKNNTYYLGVADKSGVTKFYQFGADYSENNKTQRAITDFFLEKDQEVSFYYGTKPINDPMYREENNVGYNGTLTGNKFKAAFNARFSFYLKSVTNAEGHSAYDLYVGSSYINVVKVKLKDKTVYLALNETSGTNVYLWRNSNYYAGAWPGTPLEASYSIADSQNNTVEYDLSAQNITSTDTYLSIIFNSVKSGTTYYKTNDLKFNTEFAKSGVYFLEFENTNTKFSDNDYVKTMTKTFAVDPEHVTAADDASDDMIVREVSAKNSSTFKNYVCVSRTLATGKTDKTVAYVNFEVTGTDLTKTVSNFEVTRTSTDADGNPTGEATPVFVYNSPVGLTLADINSQAPTETGGSSEHLNDNYVLGGTYVMLYFGTEADQYYALNVTIETEGAADFKLTACASNIDKRNRYDVGYGEEFGYYLGGEFNGLPMWDPRFAAKFTETEVDGAGEVSKTYLDSGTWITYDKLPTKIDVTLEIELTSAGDTFKLYRLDGTGTRQGGDPTLWFIPKNIHKNYTNTSGDADSSPVFNKDLNLIVSNPGTYRIHYVGNVEYKPDKNGNKAVGYYAYDRKENKFLCENDYNGKTTSEKYADGLRYIILGNWNGVVDNLYVTRLEDDATAEVTVTLNANGGKFEGNAETATVKVEWGERLDSKTLPAATNGDKTFVGWYTDSACTQKYDFNTPVTGEFTLYAQWSASSYTVTFDPNGGNFADGVDNIVLVAPDAAIQTAPTDPTRDGYAFDGWFQSSDCTGNPWKFGANGDKVTQPSKTLYAKWTKLHQVTFYPNGGAYSDSSDTKSQSVRDGGNVDTTAIVEPTPPTDKEFVGWYNQADGGVEFNFNSVINKPVELFAQYGCKITFDARDGTPSVAALTTDPSCTLSGKTLPTASKTGYTFDAWYTDTTWAEKVSNTTKFSKNTKVYARYKAEVTFNLNGAPQITTPAKQTVLEGAKVTAPTVSLTGHSLVGWYTDSACTEAKKWNFDNDTVTEAITLYAKFEGASYAITAGTQTTYTAITKSNSKYTISKKQIAKDSTLDFYENGKRVGIGAINAEDSLLMTNVSGSIKFTTSGKYNLEFTNNGSNMAVDFVNTGVRLIGVIGGVTNWNPPGMYEFVEIDPISVLNNNTYVPPKMYMLSYTVKSGDSFRVYRNGWIEVRSDSQAYANWGSGNLSPSVGWKCNIYVLVHADNSADVALSDA